MAITPFAEVVRGDGEAQVHEQHGDELANLAQAEHSYVGNRLRHYLKPLRSPAKTGSPYNPTTSFA